VWLRLSRSETKEIENLRAWLTTIVARVCLNMLRSRNVRREQPMGVHVPDPLLSPEDALNPEHEAVLADSVGLALQVVLDTLPPPERLAFVLHDLFEVPFDQIAAMIDRSAEATRQLASRARRRVHGAAAVPDRDLAQQRAVVDAFFAAARSGDFDALVAVLHPDVMLRSDGGAARPTVSRVVRGATAVARGAITFARPAAVVRPALVNGAAGVVIIEDGQPANIMGFTVAEGRIVEIDAVSDPERLRQVDPAIFST
jgi:RNA polymerase sigma-70 factor (ECF subfamily)